MNLGHGIALYVGLMGSGKSFALVRQVLDFIIHERRPVYTNLPFKMRVARKWLADRYGAGIAGMLRPLTREQFERYTDRLVERAAFVDAYRSERSRAGLPISWSEIDRLWLESHGRDNPDTNDPAANWIADGALLCIDEVQEWYPMHQQKEERDSVRKYLTMHRHSGHEIWIATQSAMNVSVTFRRLVDRWTFVFNKRDDKLAWCIKFKHLATFLPILATCFGYASYRAVDIRDGGQPSLNAQPFAEYTIVALLPWNRHLFRLYESRSRIGSALRMRAMVAAERERAGLRPDGLTPAEARRRERDMKRSKSLLWRLFRRFVRGCVTLIVLVAVGVGAFYAGRLGSDPESESDSALASSGAESPSGPAWAADFGGGLRGFGRDFVRLGVGRVSLRERCGDAVLQFVDPRTRLSIWVLGDDLWVWRGGDAAPDRFGHRDEVSAAVAAVRGRGTSVE